MPYLLLNETTGPTLSAALWDLGRPPEIRSEEDVTKYHSSWTEHPDTGQQALRLPESTSLLIHEQADVQSFYDLVGQWLGPDAAGEVQQVVEANDLAESRVMVQDVLPSAVSDQVRTRDEMESDGWFPATRI